MGVIGCILGFLVVIYLVYKDWSVYIATFLGACVVILFTGSGFIASLTETFVSGIGTAIKSFFFMLMFGCIQSYIYRESGAAFSIADTIMNAFLKENVSNTKKNMIGMGIILVIGALLNLGGIIAGVVIVLMYPIALAVFERCDIPKKFILGILGAGSYTFTLTIPGSPQVTNVAAMTSLGTTAGVAPIPGLAGAAVEIVVILFIMNKMINHAREKGEHFQRHPLDPQNNASAARPNFVISIVPMLFLFVVFNVFNLHIIICLILSCLLSLVLFHKYLTLNQMKSLICQGATESVPMTLSVAAICGFAAVITNSEAFQTMLNAITSVNLSPILICWLVVALMCMLTGGSSTGQLVALPLIAPKLLKMGLNVNIIHRVSVFAATTLDSMPYCGSILMLLPMCHMKLKEIYPSMFVTTVVATTCGTATVALLCALFPGLA
ncbi:MAG: hypothetical protein LKJ86_05585 [Oscillibacter sp.]|nr:hypothetical protein [Oscillibacter sp.]